MQPDPVPLPKSVQEIADVIGREKALFLIGQMPQAGSRPWRVCFYVPKHMPADHRLVQLLGYRDAARLSYAFAGMILQPSNLRRFAQASRNRTICRLYRDGETIENLADVFELSVYRIREIIVQSDTEQKDRKK